MANLEEFTIELEDGRFAFCPGELLRGSLMITLNEPMEMDHMKLQLLGQARFYSHKPVTEADKKHKNKPYGSPSKEELVNLEIILFGNNPEETSSYVPCHPAGSFGYLFEFPLPSTLPASFESPDDHILGTIRYKVTGMILRPRKSRLQTFIPIIINEGISAEDSNLQIRPGCESSTEAGDTCFPSGYLSVEGYLEKACYVQGEDMFITATARNETSRVMNSVYAKLFKRTRYRNKESTKTYTDDIAASFGKLVRPRQFVHWDKMKFPIPMTTPTITRSKVIQVDYYLRIGIFEQFGKEAHIDLPIVIGTLKKDPEHVEEKRPKVLLARSSDLSKNYWRVTNVGPRTTIEYIKSIARKPEEISNDDSVSPRKESISEKGRRRSRPSVADQSVDQLIDDIQQDIDRQKKQLSELGKPSQKEERRRSSGGSPIKTKVVTSPDKSLELIGQNDGTYKVIAHRQTSPHKTLLKTSAQNELLDDNEGPDTKAPKSVVQPLLKNADSLEQFGTDTENSPAGSPDRQQFSPYNSQVSLASPVKKVQQQTTTSDKPFDLWGTGEESSGDVPPENAISPQPSSTSGGQSKPGGQKSASSKGSTNEPSQSPSKERKEQKSYPNKGAAYNPSESDSAEGFPQSYLTGSYPPKQEQKPRDPRYPMKDQRAEDESLHGPKHNQQHPDAKYPEKVRFADESTREQQPEDNISSSGHPYRYYSDTKPNDKQYLKGKWDTPAKEPQFAVPLQESQQYASPPDEDQNDSNVSHPDERDGQRSRSLSPSKAKRFESNLKPKGKQPSRDNKNDQEKRHGLSRSRSLSPSHQRNQSPLYPTENLRLPKHPRQRDEPPRSRPYPLSRGDQHDGAYPRGQAPTEERKYNRSRSSSPPRSGPKDDDGRRNNINDVIVNDVIIYGKRDQGSPPKPLKRSQSTKSRRNPPIQDKDENRPSSAEGQRPPEQNNYQYTPRYTTQDPAGKVSFGDFEKAKKNPKPRTYILPPGQGPTSTDDDATSAKEVYYFQEEAAAQDDATGRGGKRPYKENSFGDDQPQEYSSPRPGQEDVNGSPHDGSPTTGHRPVKKASITIHMSPTRQFKYNQSEQTDGGKYSPNGDQSPQDNTQDDKHAGRGPVTITVGPRVVYGSKPTKTKYEKLYGPKEDTDTDSHGNNPKKTEDAKYTNQEWHDRSHNKPEYGYPGRNDTQQQNMSPSNPQEVQTKPGYGYSSHQHNHPRYPQETGPIYGETKAGYGYPGPNEQQNEKENPRNPLSSGPIYGQTKPGYGYPGRNDHQSGEESPRNLQGSGPIYGQTKPTYGYPGRNEQQKEKESPRNPQGSETIYGQTKPSYGYPPHRDDHQHDHDGPKYPQEPGRGYGQSKPGYGYPGRVPDQYENKDAKYPHVSGSSYGQAKPGYVYFGQDDGQPKNEDSKYPKVTGLVYGQAGSTYPGHTGSSSGEGNVSPGFNSKPLRTSSPYGSKDHSHGTKDSSHDHVNHDHNSMSTYPLKIEAASYPNKAGEKEGIAEENDPKDTKPKAYVISSIKPTEKAASDGTQKSSPKSSRIPVAVQSPPTSRYASGPRTYYSTPSAGSRYNRDGLRYDDFSSWYERLYERPKSNTTSWSYGPSKKTYTAVRPTRY